MSDVAMRHRLDSAAVAWLALAALAVAVSIFVNARMAAMLGYAEEEMIGRVVEEFMFEEDLPAHRERMAARHEGKAARYEHRFRRKDGGEVWTLVSATPLKSSQGRFEGSFALFADITERKRTEEALRRSEERFRAILDGAAAMVAVAGESSRNEISPRSSPGPSCASGRGPAKAVVTVTSPSSTKNRAVGVWPS